MNDDDTMRKETLEAFGGLTGIHDIRRVVQRGRDPQTARFTLELDDGREIRVGTIETVWSQAQLGKVLAVTVGRVILPCKPGDWRGAIAALIQFATDVEETPGETFEDTVREWAAGYIDHSATSDREGAAASGQPFRDGDDVYIGANGLAKYIRREYSETVQLHPLRQALGDLGFTRQTVMYTRNSGSAKKRSSASYYVGDAQLLEPGDAA